MKKPYQVFKVPIFPANIYVCLDEAAFRQALKDKNAPQKIEYLEGGAMAEVHAIQTLDGRTMISLVLDIKLIEDLDCTIVHESVHLACRIFEYINEETPGEEIRAYLTEYIFKEIKGILNEPNVRKRHRKVLSDTGEKVLGAIFQMAELSDGGSGSHSDPQPKDTVRRTKDSNGKVKPKTSNRVR